MTEKIYIFDTTLRDGEQSPGASMNLDEKLQIAEVLDSMRVDVIEAGFPIASNGDFEAVSEVSKHVKNSTIAGLARASFKDIDRAWEAVQHAKSPRIHTFIATSPLHMKYKLKKTEEEVLEAIQKTVSHARNLCENIEWSCEDGGRSELEFLYQCIELAINSGASTINIPDTVGYTLPEEFGKIFKNVKNNAPNAHIDGIMISPMKNGDIECILGAKIDPVFGPIVMFGLGGIYAEVMKDIVFAEAPVSKQKAEQMILSLKSKDIFYGARGKPPIEINSLLNAIINLSNFIAANSDKVDQVEMNPILVSEAEVIALDALIIKK